MKKSISSRFLVLILSIALLMSGCTFASTPASVEPPPENTDSQPAITPEASSALTQTIVEIEELAGFDVKEPTYLPTGVSFDFATYQASPYPNVTMFYKLAHETYGDMGSFFQIVQQPQAEALPNPTACGVSGNECEIIQIEDVTVNYRLSTPTESLIWVADGFTFQLLRTAGEPNKVYKDELLKVAISME